jgi:ATP-dependent DNA helicase RecG
VTAVNEPLRPEDPLTRLKGIGPKSAQSLADEGVRSILDLVLHLPRRYEDRTLITGLDGPLEAGAWVLLRGKVAAVRVRRVPYRRMHIVDGLVNDGRGKLALVWFNQRWIHRRLEGESELFLYGQLREKRGGGLQLVNPEIEQVGEEGERIVPVYPRLGRFGGRQLRKLIEQCLPAANACVDPLPDAVRDRLALPKLQEALRQIHEPQLSGDPAERIKALEVFNRGATPFHRRLAFDEMLAFACAMRSRRAARRDCEGPRIDSSVVHAERICSLLPFTLTEAQRRALLDIGGDFEGREPMARLLQGDVGSGKTVVAIMAMLMALDSGHQVALMAPTEVLAEQHARSVTDLLSAAGYTVHRLLGSLPAGEQREVRQGLEDGTIRLVIGTHALFQESVAFADLGLVVVDEQHRFGVAQRQALAAKGRAPHLLVMTATPIPRSLALTVYGDLDLSIIDELPPGRRPVETHLRFQDSRPKIFEFVRREVEAGNRVFIVYPVIDPSEEIEAAALTENEEEIRRALPGVGIDVLHGRLDRSRQEEAIAAFRDGSVQVLLATTVVEVGIDVPEASVMIIESAQRFGLSQLHQLRGRVGRGDRQAWCILLADDGLGEEARRRLEVVCASNDGFEIAEADLEMRGPGEMTGTRQWGPAGFRFADLFRDRQLIDVTRREAAEYERGGELARMIEGLGVYHRIEVGWRGD